MYANYEQQGRTTFGLGLLGLLGLVVDRGERSFAAAQFSSLHIRLGRRPAECMHAYMHAIRASEATAHGP